MEEEIKSLIKLCISSFACLSFCYFIVTKIPKGKMRLLTLLPIFYYFTILPLTFSSNTFRGITSFFFTWLANFKLLLFSFDQGPLSSNPPKSHKLFISLASLPINIKHSQSQAQNESPSSLGFALKVLLLVLVISLHFHNQYIHPRIILVTYVYLFLEVLLVMGATLARVVVGIELEPQTNEPYRSTSLQDFWGKRWNLMIRSVLWGTIYNPIKWASTPMLGRKRASLIAILATFIVSGLMHELIFFYMTNVAPTWEVTWFFVLHGVCTATEVALKTALAGRFQLHWVISTPLTIGFVLVTSMWLFISPIVTSGTDLGISDFSMIVELVKWK